MFSPSSAQKKKKNLKCGKRQHEKQKQIRRNFPDKVILSSIQPSMLPREVQKWSKLLVNVPVIHRLGFSFNFWLNQDSQGSFCTDHTWEWRTRLFVGSIRKNGLERQGHTGSKHFSHAGLLPVWQKCLWLVINFRDHNINHTSYSLKLLNKHCDFLSL